jgi:hypothetical protein
VGPVAIVIVLPFLKLVVKQVYIVTDAILVEQLTCGSIFGPEPLGFAGPF